MPTNTDAPKLLKTADMIRAVQCHDELVAALKAASGYLLNAKIDLETGCPKATAIKTIEGGLAVVRAAIAKATAPHKPNSEAAQPTPPQ